MTLVMSQYDFIILGFWERGCFLVLTLRTGWGECCNNQVIKGGEVKLEICIHTLIEKKIRSKLRIYYFFNENKTFLNQNKYQVAS